MYAAERIIVLDGPMGTALEQRGVPLPEGRWSAAAIESAPEIVGGIHEAYARAGAQVHTTNTFRTRRRTAGERWEVLARRAVRLTRAHVPRGARVAGSMGPLFDCYRPDLSPGLGSRSEHRALAQVLAEEGVDLVLCETFPSPTEAAVAVEEAARTGVPTWVALTAGPGAPLLWPEGMHDAAARCIDAGAQAVLVNCTPARATLAYVEALANLGVPSGAYANAGAFDDGLGWHRADDPTAARDYAREARAWIEAGASIVGGCCGTGTAHTTELAALARSDLPAPRGGASGLPSPRRDRS